ncbi:tRNA-2-methylthio-N(6)-dimethylallyladenosine synthase [Polynucleobacter sp. SHI8]|uniref:tRNA (N6-isopentenyl adenosine(37)-C2)-methylthiotransferase MiaB n=1 Tax=unclassified Polynucleobacter TaxID=2640945 RepID=UPI002491DCF6|nr:MULTISPECIES: tRNA (N6-isopentenyl adenosine(37)-C2)-methylthiotransferase MiaB [unclassified Polynucleobacter]BDW12068.1 tRNA-2-methylthio-N(6)-dimethylallyladenosine synthase [Polynucleobacter sp. SHI2]BDW14516.1 tRNA-2-methylthio-N(6)-dimethylallyladenosine synthase [Polynucleobacter sp. SHI8]
MKKVFIKTFGCQMNEYDSEKMADVLEAADHYTETNIIEEADLILLNTCSIREKAQDKVFSDLGRLRDMKAEKPGLLIGVGGCVASQEGQQIVSRAPYVDLVFGPQTLHRLPAMLKERHRSGRSQVDISFPEIEKFDHLPLAKKSGGAAFVSIMEGCSKYCTYCVVPYTRGEEVSRPLEDVLVEVSTLAQQGVCEITLLGQNVNAYLGKIEGSDELADFALLLEYISEIPGVQRIRYTTSHPKEFTQRLIEAHARLPKLVNHLHLPVQHGSDRILMAMKRGYTVLEYKSIIRKMRKVKPNIPVSSDFIVGFPGETDEDFNELLSLVDEIKFDNSYCFIFSPRPGTPAANLKETVSREVSVKRLQMLTSLIDEHILAISKSMIGNTELVMIEGMARDGLKLQGRTENNRVVNIDLPKNHQAQRLIGKMLSVHFTDALAHSLKGELILKNSDDFSN